MHMSFIFSALSRCESLVRGAGFLYSQEVLFDTITSLLSRRKLSVNLYFCYSSGVTIVILLTFKGQHSDIGCARHDEYNNN